MNKADIEAHRRMLIALCRDKDKIIKELQQRIDKAIEIIKLCDTKCARELLEILGDKE